PPPHPRSTLFPYTTLFRSESPVANKVTFQPRETSPSVTLLATVSQAPYCRGGVRHAIGDRIATLLLGSLMLLTVNSYSMAASTSDRKSTRLNSSHVAISYA